VVKYHLCILSFCVYGTSAKSKNIFRKITTELDTLAVHSNFDII
jgi:hypothetical protein